MKLLLQLQQSLSIDTAKLIIAFTINWSPTHNCKEDKSKSNQQYLHTNNKQAHNVSDQDATSTIATNTQNIHQRGPFDDYFNYISKELDHARAKRESGSHNYNYMYCNSYTSTCFHATIPPKCVLRTEFFGEYYFDSKKSNNKQLNNNDDTKLNEKDMSNMDKSELEDNYSDDEIIINGRYEACLMTYENGFQEIRWNNNGKELYYFSIMHNKDMDGQSWYDSNTRKIVVKVLIEYFQNRNKFEYYFQGLIEINYI